MQSGGSISAPPFARGLAALRYSYRSGAVTPGDVVDDVLARITDRGDDAVWISRCPPAALRARAAELTAIRTAAGGSLAGLPQYGVPFAVKDNIDVAGLPTTAGCPDYATLPRRSAPVVDRLLAAGGIVVGKTNLDQFATGLTGARSPYGTVESVFGGGLIAGGSSSGSAVAVAAGLVTFSLGTDTAGSGRVPAAMNGIVGVKPTRGLVSTVGVVPACRSLDCVSIFATEVADATAVLDVAAGYSPDDPWGRRAPQWMDLRQPRALRLGVPALRELDVLDPGQADRYTAAVDLAAGVVAELVPVEIGPLLAAGDLLYTGPWVAERLADLGDFLSNHPESVLPVTRAVLAAGWRFDAVAAFRAQHRLRELRAWTDRRWDRVDALLLPTVGTTFTVADIAEEPLRRNLMLGRYTQFANLLDLAAVTIPNGLTSAGRPASVSLLGPAFSDAALARLATELPVGTAVRTTRAGT